MTPRAFRECLTVAIECARRRSNWSRLRCGAGFRNAERAGLVERRAVNVESTRFAVGGGEARFALTTRGRLELARELIAPTPADGGGDIDDTIEDALYEMRREEEAEG